jgi:hypothetical protein
MKDTKGSFGIQTFISELWNSFQIIWRNMFGWIEASFNLPILVERHGGLSGFPSPTLSFACNLDGSLSFPSSNRIRADSW